MTEISFDILCLKETRLDITINDSIIKIPDYDIVWRDRDRNGEGVAIYIRTTINFIELIPEDLEAICNKIHKPKSKPIIIVTWYWPLNFDITVLNNFEMFLQKLDYINIDFIITGDLNCDMINKNPTNHARRLCNLINKYQLKQHITDPTRILLHKRQRH